MTRARTKHIRDQSIELIRMATAQWDAERQLDADAITAHISDVRAELDWIVQWEAQQVDHARACATQMRERAHKRLASLQGHLADIKSELDAPVKQLNGSKE